MSHATLEECIFAICEHPDWRWAAEWFRLGEIIVQAPSIRNASHTIAVSNPDMRCPPDIQAIGCTGKSITGHASWFGLDLDVGHGKTQHRYATTEEAITAARKVRDALAGRAEIRLSKSGNGVHVRCHLPEVPFAQVASIARDVSDVMGIRCDRSVLGRQAFWLWCRDPKPDSFKLIEGHTHE